MNIMSLLKRMLHPSVTFPLGVVFPNFSAMARCLGLNENTCSAQYGYQEWDGQVTIQIGLYEWKDGTIRNTPDPKIRDKRST